MNALAETQYAAGFGGEEFTAWLEASCRRQGLSVTVRDPGVVTQVATLLGRAADAQRVIRTAKLSKHRGRMPARAPTMLR